MGQPAENAGTGTKSLKMMRILRLVKLLKLLRLLKLQKVLSTLEDEMPIGNGRCPHRER